MGRKKKILLIAGALLGLFALFVALLAGLTLYALGKALDNQPAPRRELACKPESFNRVLDKAQKLRAVLMPSGGEAAPAEETMVFDADEVNALIYMAVNKDTLQSFFSAPKENAQPAKPRDYDLCFENGRFVFTYTKATGLPAFIGTHMNIKVEAVPEIGRDKESVRVESLTIGKMSLKPELFKSKVEELTGAFKKNPDYEQARKIITELRVDADGNLVVTYKSDELRKYVQGFLLKKMFKL